MPVPPYEEPVTSEDGTDRSSTPARNLLVRTGPDGGRVAVTVSGVFCLDDSQSLRHALCDALTRSAEGVDLDLSGLTLADCSALNVLLALRRQAVTAGKTVTVTAASAAAEHLLTFTDTYALFSVTRDRTDAPGGTPGPRYEDADDGLLQTEVVQLRHALRTRPDIDLARGILMASFGLSPDEAWEVLVTASQNTNTKLNRLARDVVTTVQGASLPDPVQRQLTEAVARTRRTGGRPQLRARTGPTRQAVCQGR
ncbi:ANTAR domain-containing protein [Streptomyces sp. NPDC020192]|uniref:ANTAR domain-containing protein n=1 Tax=Streptomyces sp. NPDC020192 TaxID=3365066 RepID=UPI0037B5AAA3